MDNSLTIAHSDSGVTAGSYGDSSAQTPDFGDTFKVPTVTVDAKGHVTSASEHTVTIPAETSSIGSVSVDGTTISSSSAGDTISLTSGANITLTPDATNKTISIASASNIISGTTEYWQTHGNVISTKDVLYVYTDWKKNSDNEDIAGIKVGDGLAYISDLPFTDQLWAEHVLDSLIHVSTNDRYNWNNKVTCYIHPADVENLVFSKSGYEPTLVTKTATGPIASFSTQVSSDLADGEFTIEAYQEGTGDPSPVNVRNIVPRRDVNICNTSDLATWFRGIYQGTYAFIDLGTLNWSKQSDFFVSGTVSNLKIYKAYYQKINMICPLFTTGTTNSAPQKDKEITYTINSQILRARDDDYTSSSDFKAALSGVYLIYEVEIPTTPTITSAQFDTLCDAFNITGDIAFVALGQDVYGGSYNSSTGKSKSNRKKITLDGTENYIVQPTGYIKSDACDAYVVNSEIYPLLAYNKQPETLCNKLKFSNQAIWVAVGYPNTFTINISQIHLNIANSELGITDYTQETTESVKAKIAAWVANNNVDILIPVAETETQLVPKIIDTFNGVNNIFCDAGNSSVTYYDYSSS